MRPPGSLRRRRRACTAWLSPTATRRHRWQTLIALSIRWQGCIWRIWKPSWQANAPAAQALAMLPVPAALPIALDLLQGFAFGFWHQRPAEDEGDNAKQRINPERAWSASSVDQREEGNAHDKVRCPVE